MNVELRTTRKQDYYYYFNRLRFRNTMAKSYQGKTARLHLRRMHFYVKHSFKINIVIERIEGSTTIHVV